MDHVLEQSARRRRLGKLAQEVRQVAINRAGDLKGWRVSRLLRDASTPAEADEAERQFRTWELAILGDIRMHSSTLAVRETQEGWVIDATKADGRIEQLLGLYTSKAGATDWIVDHPMEWWRLQEVK